MDGERDRGGPPHPDHRVHRTAKRCAHNQPLLHISTAGRSPRNRLLHRGDITPIRIGAVRGAAHRRRRRLGWAVLCRHLGLRRGSGNRGQPLVRELNRPGGPSRRFVLGCLPRAILVPARQAAATGPLRFVEQSLPIVRVPRPGPDLFSWFNLSLSQADTTESPDLLGEMRDV